MLIETTSLFVEKPLSTWDWPCDKVKRSFIIPHSSRYHFFPMYKNRRASILSSVWLNTENSLPECLSISPRNVCIVCEWHHNHQHFFALKSSLFLAAVSSFWWLDFGCLPWFLDPSIQDTLQLDIARGIFPTASKANILKLKDLSITHFLLFPYITDNFPGYKTNVHILCREQIIFLVWPLILSCP